MDCDFRLGDTSCSFKINSVVFSDDYYICFCDNHRGSAYLKVFSYLVTQSKIFIEHGDDYPGWETIAEINRMHKAEVTMSAPESVQALFSCFDVLAREWNGDVNSKVIELGAVFVPDPNDINHAFWKATPTGSIKLQIDNPNAFRFFKTGKKYLVTFTPVEE